MAELGAVLEMRMAAILVAHVSVEAEIVEEIVPLEDAVIGDHPVIGLRDVGLQDRGGDVGVVGRSQRIADVMQERTDHIFFIPTVAQGAGRRLQAVLEPVDGVPAIVALQQLQVIEHPVREAALERLHLFGDQLPILRRRIDHRREARPGRVLIV